MNASVILSIFALIIVFVAFIVLCLKNFNPMFVALVCALFISLFTPDGLLSIFTSFAPSAATQFQNFLLVYGLGGAYGYCLMASGLSASLSNHLVKVFGTKNVPVLIFVIGSLFCFAGVASYQYAILALSLPLLKKANLPKKVALAAMSAAGGAVCYGTLCGVPSGINTLPTIYLGTTTMAAPLMSIICTIVSVSFIVLWLNHLVKKARRDGEGFVAHPTDVIPTEEEEQHLPPVWKGYASILVVFVFSSILQFGLGMSALYAVVFAQLLAIVFIIFLVGKEFLPNPLESALKGFTVSLPAIVTICMVVGYGAVAQQTAAYEFLVEQIMSLDMNPYVVTAISIATLAGLTANGMGGMTLFMNSIGTQLVQNTAVNAGAIHRIMCMSAATFDSLPHNGAISFQLSVFNLRYKEGYFQQFMMSVVVNVLATIVGVAIAILIY